MKQGILLLVFGALAIAVPSAASARVNVNIGINPFGYGAYAPPVVYEPAPYYAPPPVVYFGGGSWGGDRDHGNHGDRGRRSRGHSDSGGRHR
jgi:hypothetical protein